MADLTAYDRILLYGGSFDPPHRAHLTLPLLARDAIGADVVAYIPAGQAPHKQDKRQTDAAHRLAMLRAGLADTPGAIVLRDEIDRMAQPDAPPSYTIDTLRNLKRRVGPDTELRLLIGTDQVAIFNTWKDWEQIVAIAEPVVMVRPPATPAGIREVLPQGLAPDAWQQRCVALPQIDISSTQLRAALRRGDYANPVVSQMLTDPVLAYIRTHGLYTT